MIRPQPGLQEAMLSSPADIVIAGGSAGAGKSFGLLMEPLRYVHRPGFSAVFFRRTYPELSNLGGLWLESKRLYGDLRFDGREPVPKETTLEWIFPSGARVKFAHMQHEEDRFAWKGAQVPLIGFDQLEGFGEQQFWYMLSRNRDPSGTCLPYLRGTCNPTPEDDPIGGWLCRLIAWWVDQETGYPVDSRSGVLRWFVRVDEELEWADTREELARRHPGIPPRSLTFIRGRLDDNRVLLAADPNYRANLMALSHVERERLLGGNWKVREAAGKVFNRSWFRVVPAGPQRGRRVRYWDKAGTEGGSGARTAGVRMAHDGRIFYVEDVVVGRWSALQRNRIIRATAELDGPEVEVWVEQEPGSGGKESAETTVRELAGYGVRAERVTGDKVTRAAPLSAQAEAGNVVLVSAGWNAGYLAELHAFPDGGLKDAVDASSGAFNKLARGGGSLEVTMGPRDRTPAGPRTTLTVRVG